MADFNPAIALDFKAPPAPDIIGQIGSLSQWQNAQANALRAQADAGLLGVQTQAAQQSLSFNQAIIAAKQDYAARIAAGEDPISALNTSKLGPLDPDLGAKAMTNFNSSLDIKGKQNYAAKPTDPYSAAAGGPAMVGQAVTAASTLSDMSGQTKFNQGLADAAVYNHPLAPGETLVQGPAAYAVTHGQPAPPPPSAAPSLGNYAAPPTPAAPSGAGLSSSTTPTAQSQIYGQIGNAMAADPSPQGRAQAIALAQRFGVPPEMIQQFAALPDDQWVLAGQHLQQASMTPERYASVPAQPGAPMPVSAGSAASAQPTPPAAAATPRPSISPLFTNATQKAGGTAADAAGLARTAQIESGGDPTKVNPHSAAAGLMQFVPSIWKQFGVGSPFDPAASANAGAKLWAANKAALTTALGRAPTPAELYLAHQQGATGAAKLLANPNARAGDVVGNSAIAANGGNPNAPASAFTNLWTGRFNAGGAAGTTVTPGGGAAMTMPAAQPGPQPPRPFPVDQISPQMLRGEAPMPQGQPTQQPAPTAPTPPNPLAAPPIAAAAAPASPPQQPAPPLAAVAAPNGAAPPTGLAADATSRLPIGYQPVTQGMSIAEQAAQRATGEGMAKAQVDQYTAAKESYQNASSAQLNLNQLQKSLSGLPTSGLLTPGTGAADRIGLAKGVNTALTAAGFAPAFDPKAIGDAEESQKITGKLGFDMSRALGSREAAQIVHQAISLNPGIENTPQGAKMVAASINAGLQRQKDFYEFLSQNGNKQGGDIAFNHTHPVAQYVQEAQALAKVPQSAVDLIQQHPDSQALSAYFDKNFGHGLSRYFTGQ